MTKAQTMTYGLNKQTVLPDPAPVHADTFKDAAVSRNGSDDGFGPYPSLTMGLVQHARARYANWPAGRCTSKAVKVGLSGNVTKQNGAVANVVSRGW
jgi:hypothetical protein